jgi:fluoroquinolone resistance protein
MRKPYWLNPLVKGLKGRTFEECDFRNSNFAAVTFSDCQFINCVFTDCDLRNIRVPASRFRNVCFQHCNVAGVNWTEAVWDTFPPFPHLRFHGCTLNNSSFFGLNIEEIVLADCQVHQVDFREGNFSRGNFTKSDLARSSFSRTWLSEADFTNAINYDVDIRNNEMRCSKFSRHQANRLLQSFAIELVD